MSSPAAWAARAADVGLLMSAMYSERGVARIASCTGWYGLARISHSWIEPSRPADRIALPSGAHAAAVHGVLTPLASRST